MSKNMTTMPQGTSEATGRMGIANSISATVQPCTQELFWQAVRSKHTSRCCEQLAALIGQLQQGVISDEAYDDEKAKLKRRLPILTPHATFTDGKRKNAGAIPSGFCMYDKDHLPDPKGYYDTHIKGREAELGILLVHITPTGLGLRLIFRLPQGLTLAEGQQAMAARLGDPDYDGSVKDYARCSFLVWERYLLYIDEEGLFSGHQPPLSPLTVTPSAPVTPAELLPAPQDNPQAADETAVTALSPEEELTFKGIHYSKIIEAWWAQEGGEPVVGERNMKLHRLAVNLRYICDNSKELLLRVIPNYGLSDEELSRLVESATTHALMPYLPKKLQKALNRAREELHKEQPTDEEQADDSLFDTPPALPRRLPPMIELLVSKTPAIYRAAVANAIFPPLAAHLCKTRFRYIDNVWHEATIMSILVGGSGAGKGCVNKPIDYIMADIRQRDEKNREREREWKREMATAGANKDKSPRPEGLIIQELDPDCTNAAFVQRLIDAEGHFLYARLNELDQFDALKGNGGTRQEHFRIICLAFDPDNRYGQTRVSERSVSGSVCIRFNWNASTTLKKVRSYFKLVLIDGPISRIGFSFIEPQDIGAQIPIFGTYDEAFEEALRPYIERLVNACGEIDCPGPLRLAKRLNKELSKEATLTQDRDFWELSQRANIIAYLKACVLYVASGGQWDKRYDDFIRWSLYYDLWCKMKFFGEAIRKENEGNNLGNKRGPRNLLEQLPEQFTYEDAVRVRREDERPVEQTKGMLNQWVHRKFIVRLADGSYRKTESKRNE